jgi:biopolymer transport protein ExbD
MRARWRLDKTEEEAAIDMTPMLDVVFIMLIFFIVSTTFIRDEGVQINRPSAGSAQVLKSQGIVISIDLQGQSWLNQVVVPFERLSASLRLELSRMQNPSVLIKADKEAGTGDLIKVLDLVKSLGVDQVAVATVKQ